MSASFTPIAQLAETVWHRTYPERQIWATLSESTKQECKRFVQVTLGAIEEDWIEQIPMDDATAIRAAAVACELGYTEMFLTTANNLKGLVCKPTPGARPQQERFIINTRQFGLLIVGDLRGYGLEKYIE